MSYFTILEQNEDMAGKVLVRVDLVDESVFFKFQSTPTQEEVDWEVIALLTQREVEESKLEIVSDGTSN